MLNNLKRLRDTLPEKTKLLIYVFTACAILIIACFLPLAFRQDTTIDPDFRTGERAAMFVKYMAGDTSIRYKTNNDPLKSEVKFCDSIFNEISSQCILDSSSRKALTEGKEYAILTDGQNTMKLCRMWLQDQGDWSNWIDIYMDAETGFVYYLYVSSTCIRNGDSYANAIVDELNPKTLASAIAKETGFTLKVVNWSGKAEDTANAYTSYNGEALIWNINCIYYPSSILDIKITVS